MLWTLTLALLLTLPCPVPRSGDLIFVDLDCGPPCDAIEAVTRRQLDPRGPDWSHVALLAWGPTGPEVIEAYDGVTATPLASFLARHRGLRLGWRRLPYPADLRARAVAEARRHLGAPYDELFVWGGEAHYCAELVARAYQAAGAPEADFAPLPMRFGDPEATPSAHATWRRWFEARDHPVPESEPGLSPLALWLRFM
jgi:hypothetical protein